MEAVNKNLSHNNYKGQDHHGSRLIECDLTYCNLEGADLTSSQLYRSDLTGARLKDTKISLSCGSFNGVKYDRTQVSYMLYLLLLADIPEDIAAKIREIIPDEKIQVLNRLFGY